MATDAEPQGFTVRVLAPRPPVGFGWRRSLRGRGWLRGRRGDFFAETLSLGGRGLLGRVEPRQRRARRIKAWSVGISVAFDDAADCRRHCSELVVRKSNCRHGGSGANGSIWPAMMSAELPEGWAWAS
jgi:hypothetical protein